MPGASDDMLKRPLDQSLYLLDGEELSFFQEQTGIHDEKELMQHIIAVQEKAYQTFPVTFVEGDEVLILDLSQPRKLFYALEEPTSFNQPLKSLKSLTPLQGRLSAIHASSFFHLFDEAEQQQLACQMATLLSPAPGSIIFGMHKARPEKGFNTEVISSSGKPMFCHSPETWKNLWDGEVFVKGSVRVEAGLHRAERSDMAVSPGEKFYAM
ncbi:hypothetical protein H0H92_008087 [Tricholoma furcatifolium]|nr:hypothetical protein H0H92_008087 [Tricholoma furcatifolium]